MAGLAVLWLGTRGMAGVWFPPVPAPSHQASGSPRLRARFAGPSDYTAQQTLLHCTSKATLPDLQGKPGRAKQTLVAQACLTVTAVAQDVRGKGFTLVGGFPGIYFWGALAPPFEYSNLLQPEMPRWTFEGLLIWVPLAIKNRDQQFLEVSVLRALEALVRLLQGPQGTYNSLNGPQDEEALEARI